MKEKSKLIIAIVAVVLIIVVVFGATYSYWQWSTNAAQATNIAFNVENKNELLYATLNGGGSATVFNLAPATCTNSTYAMKQPMTLSYNNSTSQTASIRGTLTVTSWTAGGTFNTGDLAHIHYAVTTSSSNCTTGVVSGMSGTLADNTGVNTVLIDNVQFRTVAASGSGSNETYYLWVWLDTSYEGENVGNTVSDPMQLLSFQLTWSGTISNG